MHTKSKMPRNRGWMSFDRKESAGGPWVGTLVTTSLEPLPDDGERGGNDHAGNEDVPGDLEDHHSSGFRLAVISSSLACP